MMGEGGKLDTGVMAGLGLRALLRSGGNPLTALGSPLFNASLMSSPSRRLKGGPGDIGSFSEGKNYVLNRTPKMGSEIPELIVHDLVKQAGIGSRIAGGLRRALIGRQVPGAAAGVRRGGIRSALMRETSEGLGQEVWRPKWWSYFPMVGAAGAVATGLSAPFQFGVGKSMDYLQEQAGVVGKAKAYRDMMSEFGTDLADVAHEYGSPDNPIPEKRIRGLFDALYKVAPDVAAEPTLASAQMASLIRDVAIGGQPDRHLLEAGGLEPFRTATSVQGTFPRQRRPSDYMTAKDVFTTGEKFSPYAEREEDLQRLREVQDKADDRAARMQEQREMRAERATEQEEVWQRRERERMGRRAREEMAATHMQALLKRQAQAFARPRHPDPKRQRAQVRELQAINDALESARGPLADYSPYTP